MTITISAMTESDWPAVAAIYQEGIDTGNATFTPAPPASWEEWQRGKLTACSLVARAGEAVVGWAALSPTSTRAVYAGVAEVSVYVAAAARGRGVGAALLQALIAASEAQGIWTLQAGIFPENAASLRLHAAHGFRVVGRRERIGQMTVGAQRGLWRDILLLERRSTVVGVE